MATTSTLIKEFDWRPYSIKQLRVLDLACGKGRNGLWFAEQGAQVHFVDRDISQITASDYPDCEFSQWDMEAESAPTLDEAKYDVVLVFNYLHRPLFPQIQNALKSGGLIFYETFTEAQANIGRPRNPDFLLKTDEITQVFQSWQLMHHKEGKIIASPGANAAFKAQLIARKP